MVVTKALLYKAAVYNIEILFVMLGWKKKKQKTTLRGNWGIFTKFSPALSFLGMKPANTRVHTHIYLHTNTALTSYQLL